MRNDSFHIQSQSRSGYQRRVYVFGRKARVNRFGSYARDSPLRSPLVACQVCWLELLEACLHVVGVVVIVG
jgi:hypothetical protein